MTESVQKHFVVYQMPGTFFAETAQTEVDSWDVDTAKKAAPKGAFAFHFITRRRGPNDLDSKVAVTSNRYFIGGEILTLDDVKAENEKTRKTKNKPFDILIRNMESNGYAHVIRTPFGNFQPFMDTDQVV